MEARRSRAAEAERRERSERCLARWVGGETLDAIAATENVSRERVRQVIRRAVPPGEWRSAARLAAQARRRAAQAPRPPA